MKRKIILLLVIISVLIISLLIGPQIGYAVDGDYVTLDNTTICPGGFVYFKWYLPSYAGDKFYIEIDGSPYLGGAISWTINTVPHGCSGDLYYLNFAEINQGTTLYDFATDDAGLEYGYDTSATNNPGIFDDDTDDTICTGAPEIPNDGIDQDCDGSDFTPPPATCFISTLW